MMITAPVARGVHLLIISTWRELCRASPFNSGQAHGSELDSFFLYSVLQGGTAGRSADIVKAEGLAILDDPFTYNSS
jgi:hypothetical protein